jgi:hypothetical protein
VRVNVGGDPERDDSGLPPVDIEIPDDARELDRDVQAYRRELRALRRRRRWHRLHRPLTRDGMVLPLLAGCLILALLTGTLLTLFASGQVTELQPPGRHAAAAAGSRLPDAAIMTATNHSVQLRDLTSTVLTLVPAACRCAATLQQLVSEAGAAGVTLYLIGAGGEAGSAMQQLTQLASRAGQSPGLIADDVGNVLARTYRPAGVTAILVNSGGTVSGVKRGLQPGLGLEASFRLLLPAG